MCNTLWKRMAFFEWKKNWNEPLPLEPSPPLMVTHIKSSSSTDSLFLPENNNFGIIFLLFVSFFAVFLLLKEKFCLLDARRFFVVKTRYGRQRPLRQTHDVDGSETRVLILTIMETNLCFTTILVRYYSYCNKHKSRFYTSKWSAKKNKHGRKFNYFDVETSWSFFIVALIQRFSF